MFIDLYVEPLPTKCVLAPSAVSKVKYSPDSNIDSVNAIAIALIRNIIHTLQKNFIKISSYSR